jgi:hypothetical protein
VISSKPTSRQRSTWASGDFAVLDSSSYFASLCSDPQFQQLTQRYRK